MVEAVGSRVLKLVRTKIGPVGIGDLKIGTWRQMTPKEVAEVG
jgi:16S rRNA U516 pseudouridylate synthase RsuA-like enzyme